MTEEWRDIRGFEGSYCVSNEGRIKALARCVPRSDGRPLPLRERIVTPKRANDGKRLFVHLFAGGKHHHYMISTLVADAFIGPRPAGHDVCHNNGDAHDNRASNLRYGTRSENMADAIAHGTTLRGVKNPGAKLTPADVLAIRSRTGEPGGAIAAEYGVSQQTVSGIRTGRRWGWLTIEAADLAAKATP